MSKDENCTCKACKSTVFHCQICKFVTFLLPSLSWLLKFPIAFWRRQYRCRLPLLSSLKGSLIGWIKKKILLHVRHAFCCNFLTYCRPNDNVKFSYLRFWRQRELPAVNLPFFALSWKPFMEQASESALHLFCTTWSTYGLIAKHLT